MKLDDKMTKGPKVKRAALELGGVHPRARVVYVWGDAMSYCNLNLTDGFVPDYEIAEYDDDDTQAVFRAMSVGDDHLGAIVERDEARKGWVFRNYGEYQPLKADVEERLQKERDRKRKPKGEDFRAEESRIPLGGIADSGHTDPIRTDPDQTVPNLPEPEPDPVEPSATPADLMAVWNDITQRPIPRCRELTDKRRKHAKTRLAKRPLSEWREIIAIVQSSRFCRGENDRGWTASFDWLIASDDPAVKALEGTYDERRRGGLTEVKPLHTPAEIKQAARALGSRSWAAECVRLHGGRCGSAPSHDDRMVLDAGKAQAAS
ncbi:MAG: hypothetical protein NUW22_05070 [Acidobacteria bacterium]|nr:hypothetical protein [Acidobacteriota bacterium]